MIDYLVGTGGWNYFNVPNKLNTYSQIFNFVELNNTFYHRPTIQTVKRWRQIVPKGFTFSVRCHQDLTHKIGLKPIDEAYEIFYQMKAIAAILQASYLILQTPADYVTNTDARDFFYSLNLKEIRLVWEYRAPMTQNIINLMQDFNIIQSVDLSIQKPTYNLDVTYSRLFGKGKHNIYQFTNDELEDIHRRAEETGSKKIILAYHGARMYTDALRFQQHLSTGQFIPATSAVGVDSAKAVLSEDADFPSTKTQLIYKQGWKVIDIQKNQTAHLSKYLDKIPDKIYINLDAVIKELKAVL